MTQCPLNLNTSLPPRSLALSPTPRQSETVQKLSASQMVPYSQSKVVYCENRVPLGTQPKSGTHYLMLWATEFAIVAKAECDVVPCTEQRLSPEVPLQGSTRLRAYAAAALSGSGDMGAHRTLAQTGCHWTEHTLCPSDSVLRPRTDHNGRRMDTSVTRTRTQLPS
jgi:hypothetical protein